jgi:hypothetical protein
MRYRHQSKHIRNPQLPLCVRTVSERRKRVVAARDHERTVHCCYCVNLTDTVKDLGIIIDAELYLYRQVDYIPGVHKVLDSL